MHATTFLKDMTPSHVDRALDGDRALRDAMFSALTPVIARRVRRTLSMYGRTPSHELVDDLIQDVMAALLAHDGRRLRMWDPERGAALATFVDRISGRLVISWLRSPRRSASAEDASAPEHMSHHACTVPGPERIVSARQAVERIVGGIMRGMAQRDADLFQALVVDETDIEELVTTHGLSTGALYVRRCRLRKMARQAAEQAFGADLAMAA